MDKSEMKDSLLAVDQHMKETKENLIYVRTCLDKMEPGNTHKVYIEDGQVFAETEIGVKWKYHYGGVMLAVADTLKE